MRWRISPTHLCKLCEIPRPPRLRVLVFFFFFFCIPFVMFAPSFFSPSYCSRNLDPGSHSRNFYPLPTTVRALHFFREKTSALSSLVDPRRLALRVLYYLMKDISQWLPRVIYSTRVSRMDLQYTRKNVSGVLYGTMGCFCCDGVAP